MSTARRPRAERVIDLRDSDSGPARWPADGWTLGSAAGGMNWAEEDPGDARRPQEAWQAAASRNSGTEIWQTPAAVSAAAARTGEIRLRSDQLAHAGGRPEHAGLHAEHGGMWGEHTESRPERPRVRAEQAGMVGMAAERHDPRMRMADPQLRSEHNDPRAGLPRSPLPATALTGATRPGTARTNGSARLAPAARQVPSGSRPAPSASPALARSGSGDPELAPVRQSEGKPAGPTPMTPWEARVAAREAQRAAAHQAQEEADAKPMTAWEARVAAREAQETAARQARRLATRQAADGQARAGQRGASRGLRLAPAAGEPASASRPSAATRAPAPTQRRPSPAMLAPAAPMTAAPMPAAPAMPMAVGGTTGPTDFRGSVAGSSGPGSSGPGSSGGSGANPGRRAGAPRPARHRAEPKARPAEPDIPPIQRRIAERPRHAAISGPREPRGRQVRPADSKWSVIDLTQPEPRTFEVPAGTPSLLPAAKAPAAAMAASPGVPLAPTSPVAAPAGAPKSPAPKVLRLDPLSYFDRASKAEKAKSGRDHQEPSRKRGGSDFTPYYRPVGELSYVAAPSSGRAGGR